MGAASLLRFLNVRSLPLVGWISLVAVLIALGLLGFGALVVLTSHGLWQASEPQLLAPFRWPPPPSAA